MVGVVEALESDPVAALGELWTWRASSALAANGFW